MMGRAQGEAALDGRDALRQGPPESTLRAPEASAVYRHAGREGRRRQRRQERGDGRCWRHGAACAGGG